MLLEEGFKVTSIDASDKMLKYALKTRWNRRKETAFDEWGEYSIKLFFFNFSNQSVIILYYMIFSKSLKLINNVNYSYFMFPH